MIEMAVRQRAQRARKAMRQKRRNTKTTKKALRKKTLRQADRVGEFWLFVHVADVATNRHTQDVVQRLLVGRDFWPRRHRRRGLDSPRPRILDYRAFNRPVNAIIQIADYLTDDVPEKLRKQRHTVRGEGEAVVIAAKMYLAVYKANAKLGGERAVNPDIKKRMAARRRMGVHLINRGFEPYVWGHDIEDLVFERVYVKWLDEKQTKAHITFGIGS